MPRAWEFHETDNRFTKDIYVWGMGTNQFSAGPYGTYTQRREEALTVASQREKDVFAEIARMALENLINDGRILCIGTPEEIRQCPDPLVQEFLKANYRIESV